MKTNPLKTTALATLALGLGSALIAASPARPQSPGNPPQTRPAPNATTPATEADEDSRGRAASTLFGREVVGANETKLGQLADFIVDSDSGRIIYGVVSSGGTGAAAVVHAVPFNAFLPELAAGGLRMKLNVEEAAWIKVPPFERRDLSRLSEGTLLSEDIYYYFGQQPPLKTQPGLQRLELVSEAIGKPLHRGEQTIGKVEDVIVHLEAQMAGVLFKPRDDFVGTDQKFLLPFGSLVRTEDNALSIALSLQDFTSAPVSTDATWALASNSFSAPYLWPAYGTTATPLASTPPAMNRGLSASRPPIEEIRQALAADVYTRWLDVSVVAAHDRVILRGTVQDEDDKRRIQSRVAQSAGGWNIDNQLRIAGANE